MSFIKMNVVCVMCSMLFDGVLKYLYLWNYFALMCSMFFDGVLNIYIYENILHWWPTLKNAAVADL